MDQTHPTQYSLARKCPAPHALKLIGRNMVPTPNPQDSHVPANPRNLGEASNPHGMPAINARPHDTKHAATTPAKLFSSLPTTSNNKI